MEIAALVVAVVAALAAAGGTLYARDGARSARRSAGAADRSAAASEGFLAIEAARRHEERAPALTARISDSLGPWRLYVYVGAGEPLTGIRVSVWPGHGVSFKRGSLGVDDSYSARAGGPPPPGRNRRAPGLPISQGMLWDVEVDEALVFNQVRVDATCYRGEEIWSMRLNAKVDGRRGHI